MVMNVTQIQADEAEILEVCRDVKIALAEMYNLFAELFSTSALISQVWRTTAQDEMRHANQFIVAIRSTRRSEPRVVKCDLGALRNILIAVDSIKSRIGESPPSLSDALSCSVILEGLLADIHTASVTSFSDDCHSRIFATLSLADKEHVAALTSAGRFLRKQPCRVASSLAA